MGTHRDGMAEVQRSLDVISVMSSQQHIASYGQSNIAITFTPLAFP